MSNRRELLMPHVTGTVARDKPSRLDLLARDAICAAGSRGSLSQIRERRQLFLCVVVSASFTPRLVQP